MYNEDVQQSTTQEEDNQGGVRTINENSNKKEVVYQENNGQKIVVTSSVVTPEIKGAVVLAKGASNSSVKSNIIQAVEAATGLPTHKIQVFEMK
jgi:stage III sporulation protein AG